MMKRIHVAAGIIINPEQQVLISRRLDHQHQGGKWEFPGGKVEANETPEQALIRELQEEVNILVNSARLFDSISFDYPDKQVLLDFMISTDFSGEAQGLEGQEVRWVAKADLSNYTFPDANQPIVDKLLAD
ncbi:8-oxo-dGTP diphosphatase MutT [Motilimonas sp. 1_MG-2023]|uniref:8-oxo-dGTP diphosphatase MutT n=1 Tax=Motilimonas sp. 1_MG-2023 TaxID=3062672 RepID=UPI0026E47FAE|nr:8-oxo-dGTP diphosphatase MutT [Motilimonas sp. 1_MG-2023]MDO6524215.1 8-oxo-dGTP diphosphatase MutT [Motilimonas sp. 1_MG-2023]